MLKTMGSMLARTRLAGMLGQSFDGDRDIYEVLGYKRTLTTDDFWLMYRRGGLAKRVVDAYPAATWRDVPSISEDNDNKERGSAFENAWDELAGRINIFHYLQRADTLAQLGQFSVLMLGVKGTPDLAAPAPIQRGAADLLYLAPFSQNRVEIKKYVDHPSDPRYGLPELYQVEFSNSDGTQSRRKLVHWSRLVHVAEGLLEDDVLGTPRLEAVFNLMRDLEKVSGSSAEMFWLNAAQRLVANIDPEAQLSPEEKTALEDEITEYMHQLRRFIRVQGAEVTAIQGQVADPKGVNEVLLQLISGTTGIPQRILTGSERGELASSSDESNWSSRVGERRMDFATNGVARPFVDRCVTLGILPEPGAGYIVDWPENDALGEDKRADMASKYSNAISQYVSSGGEVVVPMEEFREKFLGLAPEPEGGFVEPDEEEDDEGGEFGEEDGGDDV